ncbi:peptidoglycan-binding protein [Allorhizocola rhizosphaerae]|uniref:peptidoglycan-binding protein n=1 Tax=Allorhizocola rhizosphaerae TaxID=1872709 RepID=UPI000E3EE0EC|nr:peptidoglycan-binding protein [Allorhizocola rhizosphaerae]
MSSTQRRPRRVLVRVAVATTAVLVVGAATVAATGLGWSGDGGGETKGAMPPATATVTRQTLVDTQTETGKLSYGATATASARAGGTVTRLPDAGTVVSRGEELYRLDNKPVVLLYGPLPAYRALTANAEGEDVKQFEQNLAALGYTGFTVDEKYSSSTVSAVKKWQEDLGLDETGAVDLGRVVYAADRVRIDAHSASVGGAVQPGGAILTYSGTTRVVTVDLAVADQRLAKKDTTVQVTLPNSKPVTGRITNTRTVIELGDGGGDSETKIEVTVTVEDQNAVKELDQASVKVGFTAEERKDVLTVPVAALLALSEGGYGVQIVEGSSTRIIAVTTGLFASGRVEVSGDGLAEGITVGVPS